MRFARQHGAEIITPWLHWGGLLCRRAAMATHAYIGSKRAQPVPLAERRASVPFCLGWMETLLKRERIFEMPQKRAMWKLQPIWAPFWSSQETERKWTKVSDC